MIFGRRREGQCPTADLPEYAAGRLRRDRLEAVERHLITCGSCAAVLVQERRLRAALQLEPAVPEPVTTSLLALSSILEAQRAAEQERQRAQDRTMASTRPAGMFGHLGRGHRSGH